MAGKARDQIKEMLPLLIEVQDQLDQDVSLGALARLYGASPHHFHRLFSAATGETPKSYVERLRLERAAYLLGVTDHSVLDIALAVGFNNHETFSRAFKRFSGRTPRGWRARSRAAQALRLERLERTDALGGEGCALSPVAFVTLASTTLLATRIHGEYGKLPLPYSSEDTAFDAMVKWAQVNAIAYSPTAWVICYDSPTLTPPGAHRADACIAIGADVQHEVQGEGAMRTLAFAGGRYAMSEHVGARATMERAYRHVVDAVARSVRFALAEGPPVQIYRRLPAPHEAEVCVSEIYLPVRPA